MLKKLDYIYEGEDFKIINPNKNLQVELMEKMQEYTNEEGNLDIDDGNFKLYLLQTLVESENDEYQFISLTKEDIEDIEKNPSLEYEGILYFIGSVISDIIITTYRTKIIEIKQAHIQLLQSQLINMIDGLNGDMNMVVQTDKRIKDEKRVSELRKEKGLDKLEQKANSVLEVKKENKIKKLFSK